MSKISDDLNELQRLELKEAFDEFDKVNCEYLFIYFSVLRLYIQSYIYEIFHIILIYI